MRAAGDLRAHERGLGVERRGIGALELVAADVITIARRCGKAGRADAVFLHGGKYLGLIGLCDAVYGRKALPQSVQHPLAEGTHLRRDTERTIDLFCVHF